MSANIAIADLNLSNVPGTVQSLVSFKYIFPTGLYVTDSSLLSTPLFLINTTTFPYWINIVPEVE